MMVDGPVIDLFDLPEPVRGEAIVVATQDDTLIPLHEMQRRHVMRVLEQVGGNKSQAAEILGISRATIYQMLAQTKSESGH
jgi:two-component system response regulator HydG